MGNDATIARLAVEYVVNERQLDQGLQRAEQKVKQSAAKMDKSMDASQQLSKFIQVGAKIAIGMKLAESGVNLLGLAFAGLTGNIDEVDRHAAKLKSTISGIPFFGDVFKFGLNIGEGIFGDEADAEAIRKRGEEMAKINDRNRELATRADARIGRMEQELELTEAINDEARKRIQIEQKFEEATRDIANLQKLKQEKIIDVANRIRESELQRLQDDVEKKERKHREEILDLKSDAEVLRRQIRGDQEGAAFEGFRRKSEKEIADAFGDGGGGFELALAKVARNALQLQAATDDNSVNKTDLSAAGVSLGVFEGRGINGGEKPANERTQERIADGIDFLSDILRTAVHTGALAG